MDHFWFDKMMDFADTHFTHGVLRHHSCDVDLIRGVVKIDRKSFRDPQKAYNYAKNMLAIAGGKF